MPKWAYACYAELGGAVDSLEGLRNVIWIDWRAWQSPNV